MLNDIQVERWPLDRLLPYTANARTHSEAQVAEIAGSIREFGFNNPVLVDDRGVLIAGHGRLLAARRLGLAEVPVIRLGHLTETQARAFRLADNRIALNGGWDDALLSAELARLVEEGTALDGLGFDAGELNRLLNLDDPAPGLVDEDATPEPPAEPVTRPGDLWLLGPHRLLCGDATLAGDVERLLAGARPHLMVTDPPYGVEYDPSWRNQAGVAKTKRTGKVANDDRADWREAWALFPGDVAYVWHAAIHATTVAESLTACGFDIRAQIVWSKSRFALGRGDYHWQHEPCWYGVRKGAKSHWQGARDQSTLWSIAPAGGEDAATPHGTQKPVEVMRRPIVNNSAQGDVVYEPFCGSGTTLVAAETVGRVCYALELDPAYCDVIVGRWQNQTGQAAVLDGGQGSFDQIAAGRGGGSGR
ncbi:site-specific DNA-methyltransferase [Oleisolibacter albus]|uniref:site-specific DNA-methyltransferase n=1 Tax=Oleisolibacter albus TaxID=2171757 RepID=UPI000DF39A4A|nr:DNA methyltransferase [Oleisolibacter albus]